MNAGTSINQKRIRASLALFALVAAVGAVTLDSQTGQVLPSPKFAAYDANGNPCTGCKLYAYLAGTTTPTDTYADGGLSSVNAHPVVLDAAGRATVFINPAVSYKFTLRSAADVDIWTVDHVVGPFAGVTTITAANTRGLQITRAGAEAGLSITSSGGSGKTYALTSLTTGQSCWQDDSDSTPRICLGAGNAISLVTSGTTSVSGGPFAVTGGATTLQALSATTASFSSTVAVTGATTLSGVTIFNAANVRPVQITRAGADVGVQIGTTGGSGDTYGLVSENTTGDLVIQDENDGLPQIRLAGVGHTIEFRAPNGIANQHYYRSAGGQPGFLAYNATLDTAVSSGATVDFDTEVYDTTNSFAADTFTAPVTGIYQFCATVEYSDNDNSSYSLRLVTSGRSYVLGSAVASSNGTTSGCVHADMAAGHTAFVQVLTGDLSIDIEGSGSPYVTFFSGRLVP